MEVVRKNNGVHCLYLLGKNKPKKYIYVLEYPNGNSTSRLMIAKTIEAIFATLFQTISQPFQPALIRSYANSIYFMA